MSIVSLVLSVCGMLAHDAWAAVPSRPSQVTVQGTQLLVRKRLPDGSLGPSVPYTIRGVTWTPATRAPAEGPNPLDPKGKKPSVPDRVPYGFFFEEAYAGQTGHAVLKFWRRGEFSGHADTDLAIMGEMFVNTVRVYVDLGNDRKAARAVLDACYRRGIMVILTVAIAKEDLDSGQHLKLVRQYRYHPAILMWSLGNEWNLNRYFGYASMEEAIAATQHAAEAIHRLDQQHPVSSSLVDRFSSEGAEPTSDIPSIVASIPAVDVWGLNVYRGSSFGALFNQWQAASPLPFYLSEFGTDSFQSDHFDVVNGFQADHVTGHEDQQQQADVIVGLWRELASHVSSVDASQPALGGCVHEFNDELSKVGSFQVGLGGLVDYDGPDNLPDTADDDTSYDEYNDEGFFLPGAHPDDIANEEHFGLVDADRHPKRAFEALQAFHRGLLHPPVLEPIGDSSVNERAILRLPVSADDVDGDVMTLAARLAGGDPLKTIGARFVDHRNGTGEFVWRPKPGQHGAYQILFSASDGTQEPSELVTITVHERSTTDLTAAEPTPDTVE